MYVPHQAGPVGVVSQNPIFCKTQGIGRTGSHGALAALIRHVVGSKFKGHGHVDAFVTLLDEGLHGASKVIQWRQYCLIRHDLRRLFGKLGMNQRRFAVHNRVAYDRVVIGHPLVSPRQISVLPAINGGALF